jgi:hypothetical protein
MDLLILDLMFLSADLLAAASVLPAAFSTGGEAAAVPTAVSRSVQPQKRALELGIVPFEPEVRKSTKVVFDHVDGSTPISEDIHSEAACEHFWTEDLFTALRF